MPSLYAEIGAMKFITNMRSYEIGLLISHGFPNISVRKRCAIEWHAYFRSVEQAQFDLHSIHVYSRPSIELNFMAW